MHPASATSAASLPPQVHETHTGIVVLIGDRAYKAKKPVRTDFLDFSTPERRERACRHELALNSRLAPDSYLGIAHLRGPDGGPDEPVIVMRRYPDSTRLAGLVSSGDPVEDCLNRVAEVLAGFHAGAERGPAIDACGTVEAVTARWQQNFSELRRFEPTVLPPEPMREADQLATRFLSGRKALFAERIAERRMVDGHADLLADDIFCLPSGPVLLDCLDFDDELRYLDGIDDAAFLAMDLEFHRRKDLADRFLAAYRERAADPAPTALQHFYIAYRAVVRAKTDCLRFTQGRRDATEDALRHLDIATEHLRAGTVRLVLVGGGPGTGKTTVARQLAERVAAHVISTDDVRRQLHRSGSITGEPGTLHAGLYSAENVARVYDAVLQRARQRLARGESVILDGTWGDAQHRRRARELATATSSSMTELVCVAPQHTAADRIETRTASTSDATPQIAAALSGRDQWAEAHRLDTSRPLEATVAEAEELCRPVLTA